MSVDLPQHWTARLSLLVELGRPKFLVYSALFLSIGAASAVAAGHPLRIAPLAQALLRLWTTHLMTHYANEFFDLEADRANTRGSAWTGGSGVLSSGRLPANAAIGSASVLLMAAAQGAVLPGPMRAVVFAGLFLGWFYTSPPLRLNYHGLGDLTVATVLTVLTPLFGVLSLGGTADDLPGWALGSLFAMQAARMSVMNLADMDGDRLAGNGTSVVRLGASNARWIHALGQVGALTWAATGWWRGAMPWPVALAFTATAPMGLWHTRRVLAGPTPAVSGGDLAFWATVTWPWSPSWWSSVWSPRSLRRRARCSPRQRCSPSRWFISFGVDNGRTKR